MHVRVVMSCTVWQIPDPISVLTIQVFVPLSSLVILAIVICSFIDILKQPPRVMSVLSGQVYVTLGIPSLSVYAIKVTVWLDSTSWDLPSLVAVRTCHNKYMILKSLLEGFM